MSYKRLLTIGKEVLNMADGAGYGAGFALIVVLFILLIIVGASFIGGGFGGYEGFGGFY